MVLVGALLVPKMAAAQPAAALTLGQAIQSGLARNPAFQGAQLGLPVALSNQSAAQMARRPGLTFTGGYLRSSTFHATPDFIGNNAPNEYQALLGLNVPIYNGGLLTASVDRAQAEVTAARADVSAAANQLRWNVASEYVAVLKADADLGISRVAYDTSVAHVREGQILLQHGSISALEAIRNELARSNALQALEQASASSKVTREQLAITIGGSDQFAVQEPATSTLPAVPLDAFIDRALANRPELVAAEARLRSAEADARIAEAALRPQIQLVGSAGWDTDQFYSPNNSGLAGGITMTAPIFNWGRLSALARAAELAAERAQRSVAQAQATVRMDVAQAWSEHLTTERQAGVAAESVRLAEQAARMSAIGFRMGSISNLEYQLTQQQLTDARLRLSNARLDALLATYHLRWAIGESLP